MINDSFDADQEYDFLSEENHLPSSTCSLSCNSDAFLLDVDASFNGSIQGKCNDVQKKEHFVTNKTDEKSFLLDKNKNLKPNSINNNFSNIAYSATTDSITPIITCSYANEDSTQFSLSLPHKPSDDRHTPNFVLFLSMSSFISSLSVFGIPLIVARCGYSAILSIIFGGVISWYTSRLIVDCQYRTSKKGERKRVYANLMDIGEATIKTHGKRIMEVIIGCNIMTDIYILIFLSQVTVDLFRSIFVLDIRVWMIIWILIVFPFFFIRRMSILAWFGFLSFVFNVPALGLSFAELVLKFPQWSWSNVTSNFSLYHFFIGYGIIINTYNLHLSIPPFEASMKQPDSFNTINNYTFMFNTILKVIFGCLGAASYGMLTKGSVLTNFGGGSILGILTNIAMALSLFLIYPTSVFVFFEMIDLKFMAIFQVFSNLNTNKKVWILLSRLLASVLILTVAVLVPNFELVTGFVGSIRGNLTGIALPVYVHICLNRSELSQTKFVLHWLLILFSIILALIGAGFSIAAMIVGLK